MVGREHEAALLGAFVTGGSGNRALVLTGEAGMGKTTLWGAGVRAGRNARQRVLVARPTEPEIQLSFAALADLLAEVDSAELSGVPRPQLRALDISLFRGDTDGTPPSSFAVAAGLTSVLRLLATDRPVLVAIDDVPWLDRASADALAFAARRLEGHPVRFLLARRIGEPTQLELAFPAEALKRLEVEPLSFGATRALLSARLQVALPRRVVRRLFEASQGNPLFALELGRALAERGVGESDADLPLPRAVDDLFGARLQALSEPLHLLLLAVGLSGEIGLSELAQITVGAEIDEAVELGLLQREGQTIRAAHPLLAEAAKKRSSVSECRLTHARLASAVSDEILKARHIALAAEAQGHEIAAQLSAAAARARERGAFDQAAELAREALRLTPDEDGELAERILVLAEYMTSVSELASVNQLLTDRLAELPPGNSRARAYVMLADCTDSFEATEKLLNRALTESVDVRLRGAVLAQKAVVMAVAGVERLASAETIADEAARLVGIGEEPWVDHAVGWTRILRGRSLADLRVPAPSSPNLFLSPQRLQAIGLAFRGQVGEAREIFLGLLSQADAFGDVFAETTFRLHLAELEVRAGNLEAALEVLDQLDEAFMTPFSVARCKALIAAYRGDADVAEHAAADVAADSEACSLRWNWLEALRASGIAALAAHRSADTALREVWEHTQREGVLDPGAFPAGPDLVEALVALGEMDEARAVSERLAELSREQDHPWGLASVKRCRGLLGLASAYDEAAAALLREAADDYRALGLRFDEARSLLVLGRTLRRHRKWAAARETLERSIAAFEDMAAPAWAEQARAEVQRIAGRTRADASELTPTERRVAELAAGGMSNKEIAAELVVSVYTVEKHLSHVYAKLGVHSRSKLATALP